MSFTGIPAKLLCFLDSSRPSPLTGISTALPPNLQADVYCSIFTPPPFQPLAELEALLYLCACRMAPCASFSSLSCQISEGKPCCWPEDDALSICAYSGSPHFSQEVCPAAGLSDCARIAALPDPASLSPSLCLMPSPTREAPSPPSPDPTLTAYAIPAGELPLYYAPRRRALSGGTWKSAHRV